MPTARWHDDVWVERYGHVCPPHQGKIVPVHGLTGKDTYNPSLYEYGPTKILAMRAEKRESNAIRPSTYHPSVYFARHHKDGWRVDLTLQPFDMLEDPFFLYVVENGMQRVVFGGVRVRNKHGEIIPQTEFYKGDTLETLERISFVVVHGMKDVRLLQLPDGRFLVCKRPRGDKYKRGRITLHVIDTLEQVVDIVDTDLPTLAVLDSCQDALDWVGINEVRIIKDHEGHAWVGLLGHVALEDHNHVIHYAACTYKISLQDLLDQKLHKICPRVIATRSCFEVGPVKAPELGDVIFPGHLEHVQDYTYRLWAGLSDARIGVIELDDPFQLKGIVAVHEHTSQPQP
jgi:hypothetical protein